MSHSSETAKGIFIFLNLKIKKMIRPYEKRNQKAESKNKNSGV